MKAAGAEERQDSPNHPGEKRSAAVSSLSESVDRKHQLTDRTIERLNGFFRSFAGAKRPLLLLDYDGTLAPFRIDRFKARPWAGVRELLARIQNQGRTRMVVVSGRPAEEILPLLGLEPAPEIWGLHGSERLHSDGRREIERPNPKLRATLDRVGKQLQTAGGLMEKKPNAVVMHWRGVSQEKARMIEKRTRELFEPLARMDGLALLEFEAGLELRAGRDKGQVVKLLLEETSDGRKHAAAYLGDDNTDEAAFRAIRGHGLGVLVRRKYRDTAASLWLRPPLELKEFLKRWLEACYVLEEEPT
jgi:trehalose-phosphatase